MLQSLCEFSLAVVVFSVPIAFSTFAQPGKSLYTTIRELVENSLDAAESIEVLPEIAVTIEELTEAELNHLRGVESRERMDLGLFKTGTGKVKQRQDQHTCTSLTMYP